MLVIAHGIVGRADLPIPEALFGAAAAAVLVVSFLALAAGWSRPRLEPVRERRLFRVPVAVEVLCGAIGIAVFAAVVSAGLAGTGEADALLNPYAANPAPIKFIVTAFVGGKNLINFWLESESPEVDQARAGVITSVSHRLYAQKLTIDIAPNLQQPANNVYSSLQRLETSIGLKSGKNMLMALTDCPKARENQFQLRLTFVPNPTPPSSTTATAVDGARGSG